MFSQTNVCFSPPPSCRRRLEAAVSSVPALMQAAKAPLPPSSCSPDADAPTSPKPLGPSFLLTASCLQRSPGPEDCEHSPPFQENASYFGFRGKSPDRTGGNLRDPGIISQVGGVEWGSGSQKCLYCLWLQQKSSI